MSYFSLGIPDLSLRHLKAAMLVARHNNLTKASTQLNRSQTAITKAINELEADLGVRLFERTPLGMIVTTQGAILVRRIERMASEFEAAAGAYLEYKKGNRQQYNPIFLMGVSYKRLASIIAIHDYRDVGIAADRIGVTRTAVYTSLRHMEELLDLPLFERSPYGFSSTSYCRILVKHLKLAFSQLRHGLDELASFDGVTTGHLAIGTLPYSRTILTPRAINRLLEQYPGIKISTEEGPYNLLESALRCGELDLIIGAIRPVGSNEGLLTEKLFEDRLSVIARKGHPLEREENLSFEVLEPYSWVLPSTDTPSRHIFDKILQAEGVKTPSSIIETSSLANVRGLLLESNRLALLSEHQIFYEKKYGLLVALAIDLQDTFRPIGITLRAHTPPSSAAALFIDCLRKVVDEITNPITQVSFSSSDPVGR